MQAQQMAASLEELAGLLVQPAEADKLIRVARALKAVGSKPVVAALKKVEKHALEHGRGPASFPAAELIDTIGKSVGLAGVNAPAKEYQALAALLRSLGNLTSEELSQAFATALAPPAKAPKASKPSQVDTRALADQLTIAAASNERFDALVDELSGLSKQQLAEIADIFLGYGRAYKTKAEVLKSIKARQLQDALEASRDRRISKIAV